MFVVTPGRREEQIANVEAMRTSAIVLVSAATVALGACGGGDQGEPLPRADLAKQVNTVCDELERLGAGAKRPGREEIGAFFDRTIPQMRQRLDRLPAPDRAPRALAQEYARFVEVRREELAALGAVEDTVGDLVEATAASQRIERLRGESAALAAKLGFKACGR